MRVAWDTSLGLGGLSVLLSRMLVFYRVPASGGLRGAPLRCANLQAADRAGLYPGPGDRRGYRAERPAGRP
ncbi:hypothetical protein OH76DRAFT_347423 [Lentinus brumalis]|uniref:Uncharacterized protein n=1 Tax=Lentinus brumalis TaxID=2498619 RepID=A0A371DF11_9APHY|nr:hypothetical protein OH76DRAFT_347423 [Polyporus brumalis]